MNIEYFKYLETVAKCGSIRQAANQLHLKQQNLSAIVKNIENYYDLTLFERSHKGITLTEDGKFFMERVAKIHALLQELESTYLYPSKLEHQYVVQNMTVYIQGVVSSEVLAAVVDEFHKYFPYVKVSLIMKNKMGDVLQAVQEEADELRIGFIYTTEDEHALQERIPENIHTMAWLQSRLYAVTGKNNKEAQRLTDLSIYDLLNKELILYAVEGDEENFIYQLQKRYGTFNIKYVTNNSLFRIELLKRNNYWSIGRIPAAEEYHLMMIPLREDIYAKTYFVYSQGVKSSFILQSFFKIAHSMLDKVDVELM